MAYATAILGGGPMGHTQPTQKPTPTRDATVIEQAFYALSDAINEVDALTNELGTRLQPIRHQIPPAPSEKSVVQQSGSPIHAMLRGQQDRLNQTRDQLQAILRTIEI